MAAKQTALLTTREVSEITGLTLTKICRLIEAGRLPAIDTCPGPRPRWGIRREDLEAFLTPSNVAPRKKAKPARRTRIDRNVPQVF